MMTEEPADFAGLLRRLRDEAGLTQEELAAAARLGVNTVADLEQRRHRTCQKQTALRLAGALGLTGPVCELFLAAARGRMPTAGVQAARADAPKALAALATQGPASAAAVPVPRELPADVSAFTGRAVELAQLDFLLPGVTEMQGGVTRPVVISAVLGTAGVGKTALAVRWAHRVANAFPDGQLYVNLRGYDPDQPVTAAEALASFLRALGVAGPDIPLEEAERAARFRSVVAGKELLIMLDNAATEEQVRPLLPGSSSVMVVVTSRDSLAGLVARDGARRLDLDLLPVAEAVALLATLIGERVDAEPEAAEALAEQCARLPLALRVAAELAATKPNQPLAALSAELAEAGERLELLDAGGDPRGAVASVFSWSYRHLADATARGFRLLGLHPGTDWDRYAAAALTNTSLTQAGQLLAGLSRAHLIQLTGPGRYSMHDLLRAYAARLAAAHDSDEARRKALTRLFDYYLAACAAAMDTLAPAERHFRPRLPPLSAPVPEVGNHDTARAWLNAELATLIAVTGYTAGHGWPSHTTHLAATLQRYLVGGHHADGVTIQTHALNAARDCGDRVAQARAHYHLGVHVYSQGRFQHAADCHRQALALARDMGDRQIEAAALLNLAVVLGWQCRFQEAVEGHQQALALRRELGDQSGEAYGLTHLASMYVVQGHYEQATQRAERALELSREIGDELNQVCALLVLSEVSFLRGAYQSAVGCLQQAYVISCNIGDRVQEASALNGLGEVYQRIGRYNQGAEHCQQALALFRETGDLSGEAEVLNGAGRILLATGQLAQAQTSHTTALEITCQTGNTREQARALTGLAEVCRRQGQYGQAAQYDRQAIALYQKIGARNGEAEALNGAGETFLATGQSDQARTCHDAALTLTRRIGYRYQQARAHHGLGDAYSANGQPGQARQHWRHAHDLYTDLGVPEAALICALGTEPAEPEDEDAQRRARPQNAPATDHVS